MPSPRGVSDHRYLGRSFRTGSLLAVFAPQQAIVRSPKLAAAVGAGGACGWNYSFHFSQSYMLQNQIVRGDEIYAQFWSRDSKQTDRTGVGLTDAVAFQVCR